MSNLITELASDAGVKNEIARITKFFRAVDLSDHEDLKDKIPECFARAAKLLVEGDEDALLLELARLDFMQAGLAFKTAQTQLEFWHEAMSAAEAIGRIALRLMLKHAIGA